MTIAFHNLSTETSLSLVSETTRYDSFSEIIRHVKHVEVMFFTHELISLAQELLVKYCTPIQSTSYAEKMTVPDSIERLVPIPTMAHYRAPLSSSSFSIQQLAQ